MSKETEPTPSRRQLREAKLAQESVPTPAIVETETPSPTRPAAPAAPESPAAEAPKTPAAVVPKASGTVAPKATGSVVGKPVQRATHGRRSQVVSSTPADAAVEPTSNPVSAPVEPPRERSSQVRARDRAALRAYKELVDSTPPVAQVLPSRRALRLAQLEAERAPITSVNPVVQADAAVTSVPAVPAVAPTEIKPPVVVPAKPASKPTSAAAASGPSRPAPSAPVPGVPVAGGRRTSRRAAAKAIPFEPEATAEATDDVGLDHSVEPATVGEQVAAVEQAEVVEPAALPDPVTAVEVTAVEVTAEPVQTPEQGDSQPPWLREAPEPEGADFTVPETTAGPQAALNVPDATSSAVLNQTPSADELQELAQQRALAERAAVLEQRAEARERLLAESAKSRKTPSDPTATHNLAMVTPLEFIDVPGVDRPVLRPPTTTHVPVVTTSGPKVSGRGARPLSEAARFDAALSARRKPSAVTPAAPVAPGRSSTLLRAEQLASEAVPAVGETVTRTQMPPVPADYAHGLEPLDAVTAGLGRTQRNLLIQWGSLIVGGGAFIVGAVMLISALAR